MWVDEWSEWTPAYKDNASRPVMGWRSAREFTLFYTAGNPLSEFGGMALYAEDGRVVEDGEGRLIVEVSGETRLLKEFTSVGDVMRVERGESGGFAVFCSPPGIST